MTREPFIAHSELTNEIYIVVDKEKYCVTEQAIKAVKAIKALEQESSEDVISREPFIDSTICEGFSCDECSFNRKDKGGCILEERVMNLPSLKVLNIPTRKKGKWICFDKDGYPINPHCTNCGGEPYYFNNIYQYKYCPYCGAKMESEG